MGYTGVKKGYVSNSLGLHLIWSRMQPWAFWHLFHQNRPKNEKVPTKKPKFDEGGSENCYLCYYFSFVPFFTSVQADMYVFQVKESILKGFEKIGHFVFPKNVVLCHRPRGRFCGCARNRLQFWCFVKAEWNINHTEGYSENLNS